MYLLQSGKCIFAITEYMLIRTVNLSAYPILVFWIVWDPQHATVQKTVPFCV